MSRYNRGTKKRQGDGNLFLGADREFSIAVIDTVRAHHRLKRRQNMCDERVDDRGLAAIQSVDGKDNFETYCAVCHGTDAKSTGPAAPAMKVPVPDLTRIAQRNKGKFNPVQVEEIIRFGGKTSTPAHGIETMPIWGDVFRSEPREKSLLRIRNLVKYVESIQVPAGSM